MSPFGTGRPVPIDVRDVRSDVSYLIKYRERQQSPDVNLLNLMGGSIKYRNSLIKYRNKN